MRRVSVTMSPDDFLAGWNPEGAQVFLNVIAEALVGKELAARVHIRGTDARATIIGTVAVVRRKGKVKQLPPGVALKLEPQSISAVQFLARVARGEPVSFRERGPRYVMERKLKARLDGSDLTVTVVNLSQGGCFVKWPAKPPEIGATISLRLGRSVLSPSARAVVCWVPDDPRGIGLRILAEGRAGRAWKELVAEAEKLGVIAA